MSYADQLKHPRWQKKRLEIMDRDEWMCQECGDIDTTLTVHHKSYKLADGKFADIWDYSEEDLVTLCIPCHAEETADLDRAKKNIYFFLRERLDNAESFYMLLSLIAMLHRNISRRITSSDMHQLRRAVRGELYQEGSSDV